MNDKYLNRIINESIQKVLNEDFFGESDNGVGDLLKDYFKKHKKGDDKKKRLKTRKKKNGGKEVYDYDDYQLKNKKISIGDASSISNTVDMEKTNIASVARDLFPDHTEEGAQSQLRKILNGERPMSKNIASKIEKMISAGKIAVK